MRWKSKTGDNDFHTGSLDISCWWTLITGITLAEIAFAFSQ